MRRTQRPAESEDEIYLGGHTFPEDSEISAELVPRTEGKVSILVVHIDFANCSLGLQPLPPEGHSVPANLAQEQVAYHRPLYAVYDLETGLQLQGRGLGNREVAYIDYHEGRAKETDAKQKGTSSGTKPRGTTNLSVRTQGEASVALEETHISSITTRPRGQGSSALIQSSASSSRVPTPLIENSSLLTRTLAGKNHSVFMENLLPYQDIPSDPNRTPLSLKLQAIELDAIRSRERVEARFLMDMIEGRASVIDTMYPRWGTRPLVSRMIGRVIALSRKAWKTSTERSRNEGWGLPLYVRDAGRCLRIGSTLVFA